MKKFILSLTILSAVLLSACGNTDAQQAQPVKIQLSDDGITVDGQPASGEKGGVYISNDIVFYLENQGEDYGEGEKDEEHSQAEADRHTVVNITQPGDYIISGTLSAGQIAVKLDDKTDSRNRVNITLDNVNITSTVAPAIICYSAFECGSDDVKTATKDVDTSAAGFNLILADGSVNNVNGSHVARIFDENGKKLHKYDAAIESLVSFNISGGGTLNLTSDNEGIETKMHMTINGGDININSCDDSLNAGEDGVSVITINGGNVHANANNGLEGDGIDSNGWLVINGGKVSAFASEKSMDSGLDSDNGIYINGGVVYATGCMYDQISKDSAQNTAVFRFDMAVNKEDYLVLKSSQGDVLTGLNSPSAHTVAVYSSPQLAEGDYTLYKASGVTGENSMGVYLDITATEGEEQLCHGGILSMSRPGMGAMPQGGKGNAWQQGANFPQDGEMPQPPQGFDGGKPQDFDFENMPDWNGKMPEDMPQNFDKGENGRPFDRNPAENSATTAEKSTVFTVHKGVNNFGGIQLYK